MRSRDGLGTLIIREATINMTARVAIRRLRSWDAIAKMPGAFMTCMATSLNFAVIFGIKAWAMQEQLIREGLLVDIMMAMKGFGVAGRGIRTAT